MSMSTQVLILGAGYAGLIAAGRLFHRRPDLQITVVDPQDCFVQRIRLHQVAAGQEVHPIPLLQLLPRGCSYVRAKAVAIDKKAREVHLNTGQVLSYGYLIYALGSASDLSRLERVEGASTYALSLSSRETALKVAKKPATQTVVIGGGLTGIEVASELAETHPGKVTLVSRSPLGEDLSEGATAYLRAALVRLGVTVEEGWAARQVRKDHVVLENGQILPSDRVIVTTGVTFHPLAKESGLPIARDGRILVDESLAVSDSPEIFVAGDAAHVPHRLSCQSAMPMGIHVAEQIVRQLQGQAPLPHRFAWNGLCISLGRKDGIIQPASLEDNGKPTTFFLKGKLAAFFKEQVCRYTVWMIRNESRGLPVYRWRKGRKTSPALVVRSAANR